MINPKVRVPQPSSLSTQTQPLASPETLAQTGVSAAVSEDDVRIHAYQLFERRGGSEGHAVEDWLAAETHLKARKNRANKTTAR